MPGTEDNSRRTPEESRKDRAETNPPLKSGYEDLRRAALQTSSAILAAQSRAEEELVRAKEELAEANVWQTTILDSAQVSIFATDPQGIIQTFNRAAQRMLGYDADEIVGKCTPEIIHDPEEVKLRAAELTVELGRVIEPGFEVFVAKARAGVPEEREWTYLRKDGHRFPVRVMITAMFSAAGILTGLMGIATDLTEQKRIEQQLASNLNELRSAKDELEDRIEERTGDLRRSEERLRLMIESVRDYAILMLDSEGRVVSWNEGAQRMKGYSAEEILGQHFSRFYPEESIRSGFPQKELAVAAAEGRYEDEGWRIRKDGSRFLANVVITALVDPTGQLRGFCKITRDITERKESEAELLRLAAVVEKTADSIVITDTEGNIRYVNPAFELISGYSKEEVLNQNPRILKSDKTDPLIYRELWETITRGNVWSGRLTNKKKDGTIFEERVTISPVYNNSGQMTSYVAIKQDITEQIQLEEQLRQSQKLDAIGQLAGGVAHDFNNLLTVISGYSELILKRLPPDSPFLHQMSEIRSAGRRAAGLTGQLLAFSRKQILQPRVLELDALIVNLEKMLGRLLGEDVDLVAITGPDLGQVRADPGQVEQIIVNLTVNARDAMPRGGKITLETANVVLTPEYSSTHRAVLPGNYVRLSVSDTGMGMDSVTRERIFEPFFTTKPAGKGTGLGLSTVYGIVNQSGGYIWVYSEPGIGSTFKVYLPRIDSTDNANLDADLGAQSPVIGTETILLVEDAEEVRQIAEQMLTSAGYEVLVASCGSEALEIARQRDFCIDLILTDVVMPQMSGRELIAQLSPKCKGVKVLYMSGYTDDAIVRHGLLDEQLNFLQKPFSAAELQIKVRSVLHPT